MGCKDGIYERRFAQARLACKDCQTGPLLHGKQGVFTNADDIELKTTLQELALNLGGDTVEADMALGHHWSLLGGHCGRHDFSMLRSVCSGVNDPVIRQFKSCAAVGLLSKRWTGK